MCRQIRERRERERESDHAHIYIYLKIVIQNANTKHNEIYYFSLIESRESSSRTSPAATRLTTCSGNLAMSFTSTIFFLFIVVSFCLVVKARAFMCVSCVKGKRGVSQLLKP